MKGKRLRSNSGESRVSLDDDEIQMNLAPYIQTYLSHSTGSTTCGCLPVPFERAANHSWIRPCFDSDILEGQFKTSSSAHFVRRFRYGIGYLMGVSVIWLSFSLYRDVSEYAIPLLFTLLTLFLSLALFLSYRHVFITHSQPLAVGIALLVVSSALIFCLLWPSSLSHLALASCCIMTIYTIFPLPPYVSLIICTGLSVAFQTAEYYNAHFHYFPQGLLVRGLCLLCINMIGFHIVVMIHVRMRGTFMKVGQRLLVRRQLEAEKQLKEKMIHSVMPPKVASWLLNPNPSLTADSQTNSYQQKSSSSAGDIRSLFRPFNMVRMENVSILFADIVGFTKMSSNKTAEEIVDILNDLFNRFDQLCLLNNCEKISTLGDCYYCVSGCPEPRPDHATCCVQMGLGMIDAIQEFDLERGEEVNMRVGVHTGTVLCGVVGTRRFKFDVWSNDVTFANKLESTGLAGRVHVSEQTANFLQGAYKLEPFESSLGVSTYLIEARPPAPQVRIHSPPPLCGDSSATSPPRSRLNSYNAGHKRPHYLSLITDVRSKFASLPNVLESSTRATGSSISRTGGTGSSIRWQFPFPKPWRDPPQVINMEQMEKPETAVDTTLDIGGEQGMASDEHISLCPSAISRKDSGIKSTSRRSSIQHQIYLMNGVGQQELLTRHASGYFTSSRSSLPHSESECDMSESCRGPLEDMGGTLGTCFYSLRKQSDLQLIRCVRDISDRSYFVKVPLRSITLRFRNDNMEAEYRKHAHHIHDNLGDSPRTLSTARYNTYLDIWVSTVVLISVVAGLWLLYRPSPFLLGLALAALAAQLSALALCSLYLRDHTSSCVISLFSDWYPWHAAGGVLVSLPMVVTLASFTCLMAHPPSPTLTNNTLQNDLDFLQGNNIILPDIEFFDYYFIFLVLASLAHFCNFTQLNSFLKNAIAVASVFVFLSLTFFEQCQLANSEFIATAFVAKFVAENVFINPAESLQEVSLCCEQLSQIVANLSHYDAQTYFKLGDALLDVIYQGTGDGSIFYVTPDGFKFLETLTASVTVYPDVWKSEFLSAVAQYIYYDYYELVLNIGIVLILIVLLNRELEINYRASYFFNVESNKDKIHVQHLKNQADMLLENIIPKHVSVELKNRAKYCENHTDVGIIFASIVNFNKLYDETYSGGKEYLRYLNELISDFDELLKRFSNVEKIKTIGSTFMAASGLNPELRKQNPNQYDHIYELVEFAKAMYQVVDDFNCDLLGFNLILRVGFNIGEVTAGVIGSSKLLYDIWGDTVNVASRMDSTGVEGRIQVPSSCLKYLGDRYQFEPRGSVYVKGKGDIMVYLLKN